MAFNNLTRVKSSQIRAVAHDLDTKTLRVYFHGGSVYDYADVPPHHHIAMSAHESPGKYLNEHIKGGKFGYKKLVDEDLQAAERALAVIPVLESQDGQQ